MAKIGVQLKIDVTKINKDLMFKGEKGTYLDATIFIDMGDADQYGNHGMITQNVKKEDRESGEKGPILGNCKIFWRDGGDSQPSTKTPMAKAPTGMDNFDSDIPF